MRAHDAGGGGGVSAGYSLRRGWRAPYPETTGYIIPTFLKYAAVSGEQEYLDRAVRMGQWELDIQLPSGAVRGAQGLNTYPIVFNTGQVILGWIALFRATGDPRYIEASARAADWLVSVQDPDGKWSRHTYLEVPHAYSTRVAWPLLRVHEGTRKPAHKEAAERNVAWTLAQAQPNGWIKHMGFTAEERAFTHTIAYTLRGLLECATLCAAVREKALAAVRSAMAAIALRANARGEPPGHGSARLPGMFDKQWQPQGRFTCLTGNAQLALVALRLNNFGADPQWPALARRLIDQVKTCQMLDHRHPGIRGAIAGSAPIWGKYAPYDHPNWAAKFFADALMLQDAAASGADGLLE
jgi:hypothetical protein